MHAMTSIHIHSRVFHFVTPPIPFCTDGGLAVFQPGEQHIARDQMGSFDLIAVTRGKLYLAEGDTQWAISPGEALILRPDGYHSGYLPCSQRTEFIWIHFHTFGAWEEYPDMNACLSQGDGLTSLHKEKAYLNHCEMNSIFIPKYMHVPPKAGEILEQFLGLEHEPRSLRNWKRQFTFQNFLQHLDLELRTATDTAAFQIAEKIELFIRQNYKNKLTNTDLQRALNYHPNYLAKCMMKIYGKTPMEYLSAFRLEQSKKLLIQTEWSIARIAEEAGFPHTSYFSHYFSGKTGISPMNYRKRYKETAAFRP